MGRTELKLLEPKTVSFYIKTNYRKNEHWQNTASKFVAVSFSYSHKCRKRSYLPSDCFPCRRKLQPKGESLELPCFENWGNSHNKCCPLLLSRSFRGGTLRWTIGIDPQERQDPLFCSMLGKRFFDSTNRTVLWAVNVFVWLSVRYSLSQRMSLQYISLCSARPRSKLCPATLDRT